MTVENLFADVLNNLVKAQYDSYVFSQSLGKQDENLLPIPTAEIKEITLDVNYAYENGDELNFKEEYDVNMIFDKLYNLLKPVFLRIQKNIADEIDLTEASTKPNWPEVKKNLSKGTLTEYMINHFKSIFYPAADNLLSKFKTNPEKNENFINLLINLIQQTINECLIKHPDLKNFVGEVDINEIENFINIYLNRNKNYINDAVKGCIKIVPDNLNIIVDAQSLEKFPPEAIQKAKVIMKMRNIIMEK